MQQIPGSDRSTERPAGFVGINRSLFVFVLGLQSMIAPLSTDMYLPATPGIATDLGVSPATVVATLSAFFFGFGAGQLLWGPLGDHFGRRGPMIVGTLLYIAGSIACAFAATGTTLIAARFAEALGACAPPVLAQAMIRDRFERREAAGVLSLMMLIGNLAPLVAPTIGGLVLLWFGWRIIFLVLAGFGVVSLLGVLTLPETFPRHGRAAPRRRDMVLGYVSLLADRRYLGYLLTMGAFGGAFFAWLAGAPFVFIQYYRISPQMFGLFFAGGIVFMMAANLLNTLLVRRFDPDLVLKAGLFLAALAGGTAMVVARAPEGRLWLLAPLLWSFVGSASLVSGNATAGALAEFPHKAGTAAALLGAVRAGVGAAGGLLVGILADGTPFPTAAVIGGLSALGLAFNLLLVPVRRHG